MSNTTTRDIIKEFIRRCDMAASGGNANPYTLLDDKVTALVKAILVDTARDRVKRAN